MVTLTIFYAMCYRCNSSGHYADYLPIYEESSSSYSRVETKLCCTIVIANHDEDVAKKLRGSAGLGGLDANNLSQLLL